MVYMPLSKLVYTLPQHHHRTHHHSHHQRRPTIRLPAPHPPHHRTRPTRKRRHEPLRRVRRTAHRHRRYRRIRRDGRTGRRSRSIHNREPRRQTMHNPMRGVYEQHKIVVPRGHILEVDIQGRRGIRLRRDCSRVSHQGKNEPYPTHRYTRYM